MGRFYPELKVTYNNKKNLKTTKLDLIMLLQPYKVNSLRSFIFSGISASIKKNTSHTNKIQQVDQSTFMRLEKTV